MARGTLGFGVELDSNIFALQLALQNFRDIAVFSRQQLRCALQDRHFHTESCKHLTQLTADRPAAQHDHPFGLFF